MKKLFCIFFMLAFVVLSNVQLSGQTLFIGGQGCQTSFVFSEVSTSAVAIESSQFWASPILGFEIGGGEKIHLGFFGDYSVLSNGKELYDGYMFDYSFARLVPFLRYSLISNFDLRLGMPLAYSLKARQYNDFGELDLLSERNVPQLMMGCNLEIGYGGSLTEKFSYQVHVGIGRYLNSLDTDPGQHLIPNFYLFNAQFHYHI